MKEERMKKKEVPRANQAVASQPNMQYDMQNERKVKSPEAKHRLRETG